MEKKTYSTKDVLHDSRLSNIYCSENYQYTKKFQSTLNKPRFTIKKSSLFVNDLTYKKINDWDNKNIISGDRNNKEAGWRKFSLIDILKIYIISDLRKIGFSSDKIGIVVNRLMNFTFEALSFSELKSKKFPFLILEYFFLDCISGYKSFLIIGENETIYFFQEDDLLSCHFYFDKADNPIVILPFFKYVEKMANKLRLKKVNYDKDTIVYELLNIYPEERKIQNIINNKKYETITIVKKDGNVSTIKAKEINRGNFSDKEIIKIINDSNYQNISVTVRDGKKINITREESIKLST